MKKPKYYTQCELRRVVSTGMLKKTCWIPSEGAIKGNKIVLEDVDGTWTVHAVYSKLEASLIENQSHNSDDIWTATSGPSPRGNK